MTTSVESKPRIQPRNLLGILAFLGAYPGRVAFCVGLLLLNIGIEMTLPQILGNAISGLERSLAGGREFVLLPFAGAYLLLVALRAGIGFSLGPVRNRTIQRTLGDIRSAIYNALQRLTFAYHDRANSGELISRATTDVWRLQDFLFACLLLTVDISVSLVATTTLIFLISARLGAVALFTMVPTIALIASYASKLQPQWRRVHDLHGAMTTVIQENIAGVRVVKAFANEQREILKFRGRKDTYLNTLLETVNYWASRVPRAQFIYGLSTPLALWLGGAAVIRGEMPIGDLAKVIFYLMAIGHRVGLVGQFTNIVQNASASAERVLEIIHEPQLLKNGSRPLPPGRGEVEFDRVSFHYPGAEAKASVRELSFVARPAQTVAIVGPTGSGKTTMVNLIPRFYDVTEGRVRIDGTDVRELDLTSLRRGVSVIFQETFLFSASVWENIAYGRPTASAAEVEECARAAQAHEFIMALESGYHTIVGERGVSLSGGQRQRIAIARAFLMDPRILILDDATASVDSQTERFIQEAMRRLCQGRTTFIIAQRFSTVKHADQILVLDRGRIVETGTHDELIQRSGFYREVFEAQIRR